jgi:hypothetical protein
MVDQGCHLTQGLGLCRPANAAREGRGEGRGGGGSQRAGEGSWPECEFGMQIDRQLTVNPDECTDSCHSVVGSSNHRKHACWVTLGHALQFWFGLN